MKKNNRNEIWMETDAENNTAHHIAAKAEDEDMLKVRIISKNKM